MIKEFEIIEINKRNDFIIYCYQIRLKNELFYSYYTVENTNTRIFVDWCRYKDGEFEYFDDHFSKRQMEELKSIILARPEIKLRHLINPYTFL